jgi:predicted HicB family RNase H-like nuclease
MFESRKELVSKYVFGDNYPPSEEDIVWLYRFTKLDNEQKESTIKRMFELFLEGFVGLADEYDFKHRRLSEQDIARDALDMFTQMEQLGIRFPVEKYCKLFNIAVDKWLHEEDLLRNILFGSMCNLARLMRDEIVTRYLDGNVTEVE